MFCRHCGAQIADGSKFCPSCGGVVDGSKAASQQAVQNAQNAPAQASAAAQGSASQIADVPQDSSNMTRDELLSNLKNAKRILDLFNATADQANNLKANAAPVNAASAELATLQQVAEDNPSERSVLSFLDIKKGNVVKNVVKYVVLLCVAFYLFLFVCGSLINAFMGGGEYKGSLADHNFASRGSLKGIIITVLFVVLVFQWLKAKKNKAIKQHESAVAQLPQAQQKLALAKQNYAKEQEFVNQRKVELVNKLNQYSQEWNASVAPWYPAGNREYLNPQVIDILIGYVEERRANTLTEAIQQYQQHKFQLQVTANQERQINLQQQTIKNIQIGNVINAVGHMANVAATNRVAASVDSLHSDVKDMYDGVYNRYNNPY